VNFCQVFFHRQNKQIFSQNFVIFYKKIVKFLTICHFFAKKVQKIAKNHQKRPHFASKSDIVKFLTISARPERCCCV